MSASEQLTFLTASACTKSVKKIFCDIVDTSDIFTEGSVCIIAIWHDPGIYAFVA